MSAFKRRPPARDLWLLEWAMAFAAGVLVAGAILCAVYPPKKGGRNVEQTPPAKVLKEGGPW